MSAIVRYSEYEAYKSNWRYMMEQHNLRREAAMMWIRGNKATIDLLFTIAFFLYVGWCLLRCSRCFSARDPPADKNKLRNDLLHVENAIKALKDYRICIIQKLKRD
jgi:hypothetical protein